MALGIVTFVFMVIFTLFYLSKSLEKKPEFMDKIVAQIAANLEMLALGGFVYSLAAIILTPVAGLHGGFGFLIGLFANFALFLLTLPLAFEKITAKYQDKINPVIQEELKKLIGWITKQEKYLGYAGAAVSFFLFVVLFR